MRNNVIINKIILIVIIFILMSVNVILIGTYFANRKVAFASDDQNFDTNHPNVKFGAYFLTKEEIKSGKIDLMIDEKEKLYFNIAVENEGYLKNASIEFLSYDNDKNLNYMLSEENIKNKVFQEINDYKLELIQINVGNIEDEIILQDNMEEYFDLKKLSQISKIVFKGTYVNNTGKETEIEKETEIGVNLVSSMDLRAEQIVEDAIMNDESKETIIVRKVNLIKEKRQSPIKNIKIEIDDLTIEEIVPKEVVVLAKNMTCTTGTFNENVNFTKENYVYNNETGKLIINVENNGINNSVWTGTGTDEYLVIYKYSEELINLISEEVKGNANLKIDIEAYNGQSGSGISSEEAKITIKSGEMIKNELQVFDKEISKGNLYINSVSDKNLYETAFKTSFESLVLEKNNLPIEIEDEADDFIGEKVYDGNESIYKSINVKKSNFNDILGEDGYIEIFVKNEKKIINNATEPDEQGYFNIDLSETNPNKVIIKTSIPKSEGILYINNFKVLKEDLEYTADDLRDVIGLNLKLLNGESKTINLKEPELIPELKTNKILIEKNEEEVQLEINLNNNNEKSENYKNPVFIIEMPEYISKTEIINSNILFNNDELRIKRIDCKEIENGRQAIQIELEGIQTEYITNKNGTIIVLDLKVSSDLYENTKGEILFKYVNNLFRTNTEKEQSLEIFLNTKNEENSIMEIKNENIQLLEGIPTTFNITIGRCEEDYSIIDEEDEEPVKPKDKVCYEIFIENLLEVNRENVTITFKVPEGLTYKEMGQIGEETYDDTLKNLVCNIGTLEAKEKNFIRIILEIDELDENIYKKEVELIASVKADDSEEEFSNKKILQVGLAEIKSEANIENKAESYKIGEIIKYTFKIFNYGIADITIEKLKIVLPEELEIIRGSRLIRISEDETPIELEEGEYLKEQYEEENIDIYNKCSYELQLDIKVKEGSIKEGKNKDVVISEEVTTTMETATTTTINVNNVMEDEEPKDNNTSVEDGTPDNNQNYKIVGEAWNDKNENGIMEQGEEKIKNINVSLMKDDVKINERKTNDQGLYEFSNLANGEYRLIFEYNESVYRLTTYKKPSTQQDKDSDVVKDTENLATTDVIKIESSNIYGINIGLIENKVFDLSLNKTVNKIKLDLNGNISEYKFNGTKTAKVEIPSKKIEGAIAYITYKISITNEGEVSGIVKKIVDYIPNGVIFEEEINVGWYIGEDGLLYNESLNNININAGETTELELILKKEITKDSVGLINNVAEIYEAENEKDLLDIDSIQNNKKQDEDDLGLVDCIIGVKTGEGVIYFFIILTSLLILGIGIYLIKKKVLV